MSAEIYLDNSASTKISEAALEKYCEISRAVWGNPSSLHSMGFSAEKEIRAAKDTLLASLSAKGSAVVFTASGTEANNLAILGRAFSKERYRRGAKIITTDGEHASVDSPVSLLEVEGFTVKRISTAGGIIDLKELEAELDSRTVLVSIMLVNNETGALYDSAAVCRLMKRLSPEALLHIDATQAYMKLPFTKASCGADMLTVSSHKIEGPKGVGALIIDEKIIKSRGIAPITLGGGQEGGLRSGTENVPAIAAFAKAIELSRARLRENAEYMNSLRNYLIEKLSEAPLSEISPTLPKAHAPHILNITLPKIKSETMLHYLSSLGIYVSSGSACSSNSKHTSSALTAYGRSADEADTSIRISFSPSNTRNDINALCDGLKSGLSKLSRMR